MPAIQMPITQTQADVITFYIGEGASDNGSEGVFFDSDWWDMHFPGYGGSHGPVNACAMTLGKPVSVVSGVVRFFKENPDKHIYLRIMRGANPCVVVSVGQDIGGLLQTLIGPDLVKIGLASNKRGNRETIMRQLREALMNSSLQVGQADRRSVTNRRVIKHKSQAVRQAEALRDELDISTNVRRT